MVEEVERLRTELHLVLAMDGEVLDRREVRLEDHGLRADRAGGAVLARGRLREARRVEDVEPCAVKALRGIAGEVGVRAVERACVCVVVCRNADGLAGCEVL